MGGTSKLARALEGPVVLLLLIGGGPGTIDEGFVLEFLRVDDGVELSGTKDDLIELVGEAVCALGGGGGGPLLVEVWDEPAFLLIHLFVSGS